MADLPSDAELTETGMAPANAGRLLLIACGALAREILDLKRRNGWNHIDLTCLPAILHNHPERITEAVEAAIDKHKSAYGSIKVVYADCGTGGALERACRARGIEMIQGPHCYSFFEGNAAFATHADEITAFYLTDFLARQFDAFVWKPLGLDRHPDLLEMYFGHYTKLVYQAQTENPNLIATAQEIAARLGLDFEYRFTGYGDLATSLDAWAKL